MAHKGSPPPAAAAAAASRSKDVLVCDICLELYDDGPRQPKFLSCHHSYCCSCLTQFAGGQDSLECPSCRHPTRLTQTGVPGLQTNFYISQLQDTLRQGQGQGCPRHLNQPLSFFCASCCRLICRDCTVLDHRDEGGHQVRDAAAADPELRATLKVKVAAASLTFERVQEQLGHLEAETQTIRAAREQVLQTVSDAWERYAKILELRKLQLLKQVTDEYNARQASVIHNAEAIGSRLKKMAKCLSTAERLTTQGPLGDVISTTGSLDQITSDLSKVVLGMELGPENLCFQSQQGEAEYQVSVAKLGGIAQENRLPAHVVFDAPNLTACLAASVSLKVNNRDGEALGNNNLAGVDILVTDQHGDSLQKTLTWDVQTPGLGTLTLTPQLGGALHFTPTFRGRLIPGAEHSVTVESNDPVCTIGELGGGRGTFSSPRAVATNTSGELFVADTGNRVIQKLDRDGRFLCQFDVESGEEKQTSTCDLALMSGDNNNDDSDLVVCTETTVSNGNNPTSGNTVLLYTTDGELHGKFNNKSMKCALCVATNKHKEIFVSDYLKRCVYMYDTDGTLLRKVGHSDMFRHPAFIAITDADDIVVTDTNSDAVLIFDREGHFKSKFGREGSGKGELKQPFGVACDGSNILVVDSGNRRIQVYGLDGQFVGMIESAGSPLEQPRGITVTGDGHVYVADRDNHCVKKYRYK